MNDGTDLEKHVQQVFSFLLNMKDEGVVVGRDVQIADKFGISHQVDVYYQFERAGVIHKVAFECKDRGRPIDNGEVAKFYGKLCDAGSICLVMVSRYGYQKMAIEYAEKHDIMLLKVSDLPSILQLIGKRIETVALPGDDAVGEPFWTIMELRNGKNTGSYFANPHPVDGAPTILLFYSRQHAEAAYAEAQLDSAQWAIRGLPRYAFRAFLLQLEFMEMKGGRAAIAFKPPGALPDSHFISLPASYSNLVVEYYGKPIPSIKNGI